MSGATHPTPAARTDANTQALTNVLYANVSNGPTMTVCMYVANRVPLPNTSEPMR